MRDNTACVNSGDDILAMFALTLQRAYRRATLNFMKDILTITDPVRISFIEALFKEAGVLYMIRDGHMADLLGQQNGLFPRRLAVDEDQVLQAERILKGAEQFYDE